MRVLAEAEPPRGPWFLRSFAMGVRYGYRSQSRLSRPRLYSSAGAGNL